MFGHNTYWLCGEKLESCKDQASILTQTQFTSINYSRTSSTNKHI